MNIYNKIKCIKYIGALSVAVFIYCITATDSDFSIEDKNIKADIAFVQWIVKAPNNKISDNLRSLLQNPKDIEYLAKKSQISFEKAVSNQDVKNVVDTVTADFLKRFNKTGTTTQKLNKEEIAELHDIIWRIIEPEIHIFTIKSSTDKDDIEYFNFMEILAKYKTPVKTNLRQWALKFLTSESLLVGLPMIEKLGEKKDFNLISKSEQEEILDQIAQMVNKQFIHNLSNVVLKFNITIPDQFDVIIKNKILLFLKEKLGLITASDHTK